jgi:hypothetical protein
LFAKIRGAIAVKNIAISFILGVTICGLAVLGARTVLPIRAATDDLGEQSENISRGLIDILPDIEKIYRESLTAPFRQAESKIYDEDIAEFYRELLDSVGLRDSEDGSN